MLQYGIAVRYCILENKDFHLQEKYLASPNQKGFKYLQYTDFQVFSIRLPSPVQGNHRLI